MTDQRRLPDVPDVPDDDLRRQLSRRADRSTIDSSWLRTQLLPEVNAAIDSRPYRVPAARRGPIGALVAIAAVILLLVVVAPRLGLSPSPVASPFSPGPTPTAPSASRGPAVPAVGPLSVMTASEFGQKRAAHELDGMAVIVDGRIDRPFGRGPICPLGGPCVMGSLDGAEPAFDVHSPHLPTTEEQAGWTMDDAGVWPWWVSPERPVEGLLVLQVDRLGSVEYLGTLSSGPVIWRPSEVSSIDIESIHQFEPLIVDGWLWRPAVHDRRLGGCTAVGVPEGLPDQQCQGSPGLLTDWQPSAAHLETSPPASMGWEIPADAVVLAGDPLYLVSGDSGTQPVYGRFVIAPRLGAGGCAGAYGPIGPCWQWQMLAVMTVTSLGESSPSAAPAATPGQPSAPAAPTPSADALELAYWTLAATERPTDSSTSLELVVYAVACASGRSPEGRMEGPHIDYRADAVTITFRVRELPGGGDCQSSPGAPVTVELAEPLGWRELIDGGQGTVRVGEHSPELLVIIDPHVPGTGLGRLQAHASQPTTCVNSINYYPPQPDPAIYERMADELGAGAGLLDGGRAFLGDWVDAAVASGAFEAITGQPMPWSFLGRAAGQPWLPRVVPEGSIVLADLEPVNISGGRTVWLPAFNGLSWTLPGDTDC